jgi:dihydrofolate reductase
MTSRKVIVYIAMSLDGFIAGPNDNLSFLDSVQKEGEDYGYSEFISQVDSVIVGKRTYDTVIGMGYDFPHQDKDAWIITRTAQPTKGNVKFYSGDLNVLVEDLKQISGKNIFVDGGAWVVNELLRHQLIDEIHLSIVPVLLGNGVRLFQGNYSADDFQLIDSKSYDTGLVKLIYHRKRIV